MNIKQTVSGISTILKSLGASSGTRQSTGGYGASAYGGRKDGR